jgi:hypothetical protein
MQTMLVISENDLDKEVWSYNLSGNIVPLSFSKRDSTHENIIELTLQSPLTAFFWCTSNANLEIKEQIPFKKNRNTLLTHLRSTGDEHLEEYINLEQWKIRAKPVTV